MSKYQDPRSLAEIDELIVKHRSKIGSFICWLIWAPDRKRILEFIRESEARITNLTQSSITASELKRLIGMDFQTLLVGPNGSGFFTGEDGSIVLLLEALIDRRSKLLTSAIPPNGRTTMVVVPDADARGGSCAATVTWRGDADDSILSRVATDFLTYYLNQTKNPPYPYSSRSILDYSGVEATHLLQQGVRKYSPGTLIHDIQIEMLPPPAPPPPEGTLIAPGVVIPTADRPRHVYILGKTGTGKSTLMLNMARQDIESGRGVVLIDPGDLVDNLIPHIPPERIADVIYFNPAVTPLPINFFNASSEMEKGIVADDTIVLFKRLTDSWGERMGAMLRFAVRTLLEVPGTTFLDIYHLLTNPAYRDEILERITNPVLLGYWRETFRGYPKDATHPITSRMSSYVLDPALTRIFGTRGNLSFFDVIQSGKILLVDIGKVGRETSPLLGSIFVSQLQLAVMRRASLPRDQRKPFYLYVDEFQNFTTSAFGEIFREARKYQLCLTVANQSLGDLDDTTRRAVSGAGTTVYFNPYQNEAKQIASLLDLEPRHLLTLKTFEGFLVTNGEPRKMKIDLPPESSRDNLQAIIDHTKRLYLPDPAPPREGREDDEPQPGDWPDREEDS